MTAAIGRSKLDGVLLTSVNDALRKHGDTTNIPDLLCRAMEDAQTRVSIAVCVWCNIFIRRRLNDCYSS